ncbi:hypothetical protein [Xenorhabdus budapestensis]|uniref:hypothetical protein n=1 Tax=Xenorhabdus budapestensis TaxID=290110 RepID=UPI0014752B98|nr:hypothetical protein [Xenorhabdus budapestensis]
MPVVETRWEIEIENNAFNITTVKEVAEYTVRGPEQYEMNNLLNSGEWVLLSVAPGVDEDGYPMHKYSLGRISE